MDWANYLPNKCSAASCVDTRAVMLDVSQTLLSSTELKNRFEQEGISLDGPVLTSYGTGVTACILALGLHRLGKTSVPVYDGSWTEWATEILT
ncbi:threonyl-tRNA synthetase [Orobanche hederae]